MDTKTARQAELFENRLIKRSRHLKKWARRNGVFCYRLYDRDIPEIPLCLDFYESTDCISYLVLYLYERPYNKTDDEESLWLEIMTQRACNVLKIPSNNIFVKIRRKQRNRHSRDSQYGRQGEKDFCITVKEKDLLFSVDLSSYLDTGLFFDHRILREKVCAAAEHKSVLNLFCYTGSFSVYAAAGNAKHIDSVDLSASYLKRTQKNFRLNGFTDAARFLCIQSDVLSFLKNTVQSWDLIVLDPPTFSNSKKTETVLDINRDWPMLCTLCLQHLHEGGTLYFSTNSRSLKFDEMLLRSLFPHPFTLIDISEATVPEDFRNKRIHRCWQIVLR